MEEALVWEGTTHWKKMLPFVELIHRIKLTICGGAASIVNGQTSGEPLLVLVDNRDIDGLVV